MAELDPHLGSDESLYLSGIFWGPGRNGDTPSSLLRVLALWTEAASQG